MSTNVTENDTFPATVPAPDVGDNTYPSVVADALDRLADRTRYHENTLIGNYIGTALDLLTTSPTLQQFIPLPQDGRLTPNNPFKAIASNLFQSFKWLKESIPGKAKGQTVVSFKPVPLNAHVASFAWASAWGSNVVNLVQTGTASTDIAYFQLPITVRAGTLVNVIAHLMGDVAGGNVHGGTKPANMPRIDLYRYTSTVSGETVTLVGGQADTSATAVIYDAAHGVTLSISESIAPSTTTYWVLKVTGESGAGSLANALAIQWIDMTIDGGTL